MINWICVKEIRQVQRQAESNLQYEIFSRTDSNCVPKLAGMEVKVKQDTGRKNLGKICLCLQIQFIGKTVQNVAKGGVITTEMTN